METPKKPGDERRDLILKWLKESKSPIKGGELALKTNVSRQVIVGDISLLKAKNEPIIATSQGYLYLKTEEKDVPHRHLIVSNHSPEQTKDELFTIVDHGVTVKNVIVEHPIYGDLTASLLLSTRRDVEDFLGKLSSTNAALLSTLTEGIHLHMLEAPTKEQLDNVCRELKQKGYLHS
ncbi:transcription repressor NadR [Fictibacillus sp. FJAT-27399]|uniref:transcription repressor NadR n=1 Tax=Fictibacillus sp. FJAT-27399 TaxID=1729689 RepID=UPI0007814313|nr:transcription repressor NadR [Fictibacillus sp. FJAT-27399]